MSAPADQGAAPKPTAVVPSVAGVDSSAVRRPVPRNACPSLVAPMATGDGLIARLLPADGALTTAALRALCDAARSFGNGMIEVTQRGSLQLRGVRPETIEALEVAVEKAGATPPPGPPVHTGPLSGLDPTETADPRPLAAALRARLAAAAGALPAKFAIVVDGGGAWKLDGLSADLRLTAVTTADGPMWRLSTDFEAVSPPLTAAAAVAAAQTHASQSSRSERRRPTPRVPHPPVGVLLAPAMSAAEATASGRRSGDGPSSARSIATDVSAAGLALPFGFTDADRLAVLVEAAERLGADEVRLAPGHGLVFVGRADGQDGEGRAALGRPRFDPLAFLAAAGRLGFIARSDDPRRALAVCAGAPACGSGEAPTRPLAEAVVAATAPLIAAGGSVHLSGCAKGCARPVAADLTIVGREGGYGLVEGGTAADEAASTTSHNRLLSDIAAMVELRLRAN